jgi:sec-independent protein translocase protein TatB
VFDIGLAEMLMLALVAVFVFGPDRLPDVARQAGRMLRGARRMVLNARSQLNEELGPGFANVDLRDLDPRSLVQKHLLSELDDEVPVRAGHRPLEEGEPAPYDVEAT